MRLVHRPWVSQLCENKHRQRGREEWWCLEDERTLRSLVNASMTWIYTPQGDDYWRNIHFNLRGHD